MKYFLTLRATKSKTDHFEIFVPSWFFIFFEFLKQKKLIDGFRQTSVKKMS